MSNLTYESEPRCFSGGTDASLTGDDNPAAHGGIEFEQRRDDGAERKVVLNGQHEEHGAWHEPQQRFVGLVGSGRGYYVWFGAITGDPLWATVATQSGDDFHASHRCALADVPRAALQILLES